MLKLEAYVVVGDDDNLCDANGEMPDSLKNDAEWDFFQAGLDAADVCVMGRRSHEATPNHKDRLRLVMTGSVQSVQRDGKIVLWNPATASLEEALKAFDIDAGLLAVVGGQAVFDFFLAGPNQYYRFHLSRIANVMIPGGRGVFSAVNGAMSAEKVLAGHGYQPMEQWTLDTDVSVVSWGLAREG